MKRAILASLCLALFAAAGVAQNWSQFRGQNASGVADGKPAPAAWDATKMSGVRWKTAIPGLAHSSPVVWGGRVYVTTAVSTEAKPAARFGLYGDVDPVKDEPKHTWHVMALDKLTGKVLWDRVASEGTPKTKRHPKATHASSTPATDGKHVVALFGSQGLMTCYDEKGKLLWKIDTGVLDAGWFYDPDYQWGHASSPIIYKNLVIVQADVQKDSFIAAYDLKTGKQVWKTMRDEIPSWSSPTVVEGKTRAELITNGTKFIRAYDPATGKELWRLGGNSEIATPTPIFSRDLIYVTNGYRPIQPIFAVKAGTANGDITLKDGKETNDAIAWSKQRGGPYMPTPIVYGDIFYVVSNQGVLAAYNAVTGERLYQERLAGKGGAFTASPVAADGKLYFSSEDGDVMVVKAGAKYEFLGTNPMGEVMMATPAVSDGVLFVRTKDHLYAIGDAPAAAPAKTKATKGAK
ncbi:MAG: PQQ-binding-like beta-propeller repeat protein [Acidobacteria bacterium]|nr:PQQ-binding-like beta-propeller repeat protein [Acidobacteriota bacterium]MCA1640588.1 PQQ-binding-like beta-propeller repeat protein [Acidobacteriota bacterium]